jgi:broad specificity phosphatase PhoE
MFKSRTRPPSQTRIWIARHGQTETNTRGVFCGHSETALTDLGRAQARALGERLRPIALAGVYTSDVSRALETAAIALEGRGLAPIPDPDLREIHYGDWEWQAERLISRSDAAEYRRMRDEDPAWQPPGGETTAQVRARTARALERIAARHRAQEVLVISHGTAINCMLAEVLGMAPTHTFRFEVSNCGLSTVVARRGRLVLTSLNDTGHLAGLSVATGQ